MHFTTLVTATTHSYIQLKMKMILVIARAITISADYRVVIRPISMQKLSVTYVAWLFTLISRSLLPR